MKKINIDYITKIEGHAKLHIKIDKGEIKDVKLSLFEGSRYFEGILKAKRFNDLPHIASRICGICSPVHHLTSIKAIEKAFGVEPSEQANLLKEMLNIGGNIQSHVLHLYFLALPDYTGHSNAIEMAREHPQHVKSALCIKQAGNALVNVIGGRDIHPYTLVPGGFSRIPTKEQFSDLLKRLKGCVENAKDAVELFCGLDYPKFERKTKHFALKGKTYFAPTEKIACTGADECFAVPDYEAHFKEYFKQGSTSEFARADERDYMVGAWSRILTNKELLSKDARNRARCILPREHNPFMNNPAQAIEILEGMSRCIEIIETTDFKDEKPPLFKPKASTGVGANEAPRGILFHKYSFDAKGNSTFVNITTPTTQNLPNLEDDIRHFLPSLLDKPKEVIQLEIEKLIRAYDPCISCATHFLEIVWEKS